MFFLLIIAASAVLRRQILLLFGGIRHINRIHSGTATIVGNSQTDMCAIKRLDMPIDCTMALVDESRLRENGLKVAPCGTSTTTLLHRRGAKSSYSRSRYYPHKAKAHWPTNRPKNRKSQWPEWHLTGLVPQHLPVRFNGTSDQTRASHPFGRRNLTDTDDRRYLLQE